MKEKLIEIIIILLLGLLALIVVIGFFAVASS